MTDSKPTVDPDTAKLFCEFQWAALIELNRVFLRGVAFYFLVIGSILGFVFATKSDASIHAPMLRVSLVVTGLALAGGLAFAYGAHKGLNALSRSYEVLHSPTFEVMQIGEYITRARRTLWVAGICSLLMVLLLMFALTQLLRLCSATGCSNVNISG